MDNERRRASDKWLYKAAKIVIAASVIAGALLWAGSTAWVTKTELKGCQSILEAEDRKSAEKIIEMDKAYIRIETKLDNLSVMMEKLDRRIK
jgi:hypothetical protein